MSGQHYLKVVPNSDSQLSIRDSKELFGYIANLPRSPQVKLTFKGDSQGLGLFMGFASRDILNLVKKHLASLSPSLTLSTAKNSEVHFNPTLCYSFSFTRHYSLPLYDSAQANSSAQSILIRHLAEISPTAKVAIELSFKATKPYRAELLKRELLAGKRPYLASPSLLSKLTWLGYSLGKLLLNLVKMLSKLATGPSATKPGHSTTSARPKLTDPRSIKILDKLYQPLFKTKLTANIKCSNLTRARKAADELFLAINNFAKSSGDQIFAYQAHHLKPDIYSSADLASLFQLQIEDVRSGVYKTDSFKSLPLSGNLIRSKTNNLVVGINSYHGLKQKIALSSKDRQRHLYMTGATGSGKSTLLANLILQDVRQGYGVSLIDPHGDLALSIRDHLPAERRSELIYFDPSDFDQSLKINLLEVNKQPSRAALKLAQDQLTESIISLFRKVFSSEDLQSHRIEYILRNTIQTALSQKDSTIFTIFRLLNDSNYRRKVVLSLTDSDLINFWQQEIGRAGDFQRVKMTAGVTSKIGRFLFSEPVKRVFDAPKSTLDFSKVINNHKILICNFAMGRLGEDGSRLFATTILTKLYLASLAQIKLPAIDRPAHYLYVDEFQTFAPTILIQMLSELRKYGLYLTMAEQSPSQQDPLITSVLLANIGNLLCFRAASPADARLLAYNFGDRLNYQDLNNLPAYNFYLRSIGDQLGATTSGQTEQLPKNTSFLIKPTKSNQLVT